MSTEPRPVFIIGGSRTGSEMLKTMLSASPELDFVDELFLLCPPWLHVDLATNIRREVGDLSASGALERLMTLLYSGRPYGWFWSVVERELDKELVGEELASQPLDLRSILLAIMRAHARSRGKRGIGAKFPTHYSSTPRLLEWFPECRVIHTTRDPRAVYASQAAKHTLDVQRPWHAAFERFRQFVHINIQVTWTARLHSKLRQRPNYRLVRYEDVVAAPEAQIRNLCEFLDIPFDTQMLQPNQYGSSFAEIKDGHGVDRSSLGRWRRELSPLTVASMRALHWRANRLLGYAGGAISGPLAESPAPD